MKATTPQLQRLTEPIPIERSLVQVSLEEKLNQLSVQGYRMEKAWVFSRDRRVRGARRAISQSIQALLTPSPTAQVYRAWSLPNDAALLESMPRLVEIENQGGFQLQEVVPINDFRQPLGGTPDFFTTALILFFAADIDCPIRLSAPLVRKQRLLRAGRPVHCLVSGCTAELEPVGDSGWRCPRHGLSVLGDRLHYPYASLNLLWNNEEDRALLERVKAGQAFARPMTAETSEDSLTWNLFRYLERAEARQNDGLTARFLQDLWARHGHLMPSLVGSARLSWWLTDSNTGLRRHDVEHVYRHELGENRLGVQDADVLLDVPGGPLILVQTHFMLPARQSAEDEAIAPLAAHRAFADLFTESAPRLIKDHRLYRQVRGWLLGHILTMRRRPFLLLSITREDADDGLPAAMSAAVKQPEGFLHVTWKNVVQSLRGLGDKHLENLVLQRYLLEKPAGYTKEGDLDLLVHDAGESRTNA